MCGEWDARLWHRYRLNGIVPDTDSDVHEKIYIDKSMNIELILTTFVPHLTFAIIYY